MMRYFENPTDNNKVYGYDPTTQDTLITRATTNKWVEVTGNWPPAPPPLTLQQQAMTLLAGTITLTSTSTSSLDGVYTSTSQDQAHINAEVVSLLLNNTFADGTISVLWPDSTGTAHTFSATEFKAFASAIGAFVAACFKCINGVLTVLPSTNITIL